MSEIKIKAIHKINYDCTSDVRLNHGLHNSPVDSGEDSGDDIGDEHAQNSGADQTGHTGLVAGSENEVGAAAHGHGDDDSTEYKRESRERVQHADAHAVAQDEEEGVSGGEAERGAVDGGLDVRVVGDVADALFDCPQTAVHAAEHASRQLH